MTELLTAAQMRAIERAAIESGQVTGLELMERAGRGAVDAILSEWPEFVEGPHRAVVLCGPGNNGGDGFVVARLLKKRGWGVEVFLYGDPDRLPPDARVNWERWGELGSVSPLEAQSLKISRAVLVVDALFGTGLRRPLRESLADWVEGGLLFSLRTARMVAIDMPSGLDGDSGRRPGRIAAPANLTITFETAKLGHFLADGPALCGKTVVAGIGLADWLDDHVRIEFLDAEPVRHTEAPHRLGKCHGHKFTHGHALILSGGVGRGGAARMAARGALRIGAGLVTLGCPPSAVIENAAHLNAIMLRPVKDAGVLAEELEDERINALCLGPGLGTGEREAALVTAALEAKRATVLDADALTLIGRDPALFASLHERCVLAPHMGEFARVFPDIADKLATPATDAPAYSKVDAARDAAKRAGCTVLLKGPDTVIAHPDGRAAINSAHYERSVPWLATAGAGDVLAGFIAGLLARGFGPFDAACAAAWLHVECALEFGPGLIAEDLPEMLPRVLARLEKDG